MFTDARVHFVEWLLAVFLNAIALFLIVKYSPKTMGKYPWLLLAYTIFNVCFVTVDMIVAPATYIFGRAYLCVSWSKILNDENWKYALMVIYCSGFSQLLVFLSFQFIYRYVVVCKAGWLPKLKTYKVVLAGICFYAVICGTWTMNTHIALHPNDEVFEFTNPKFKAATGHDVLHTGSLAQGFEHVSTKIIIRSYIGMIVFCVVLSATWAVIIFCAWSLNKNLKVKGRSTKTRAMQKELFKALIFQLIVPICCVYIPMSFFFFCAVIGFEDWNSDILCVLLMIDPILEPLVITYFIKCYRKPVARLFHFKKPISSTSTITTSSESQARQPPPAVTITSGMENPSISDAPQNTEFVYPEF